MTRKESGQVSRHLNNHFTHSPDLLPFPSHSLKSCHNVHLACPGISPPDGQPSRPRRHDHVLQIPPRLQPPRARSAHGRARGNAKRTYRLDRGFAGAHRGQEDGWEESEGVSNGHFILRIAVLIDCTAKNCILLVAEMRRASGIIRS